MGSVEPPVIVIDCGSAVTKAGFAGDDYPTFIMRSVIGTPKYEPCMPLVDYREHYVGDRAQKYRGILSLQYPVEHGVIKDWESYENLIEYIFTDKLEIDPSQHPILLTEPPLNPSSNKELLAELMFEKFNVVSFYQTLKPALSLYAAGRVSGCVLYSGGGVTTSMAMYDGCRIKAVTNRLNIGGIDVTHHLIRLLTSKNHFLTTSAEKEIAREIKESMCYVAKDFDSAIKSASTHPLSTTKKYTLPDGQELKLSEERFQCPEILFDPFLSGREDKGVHEILFDTIMKTSIDIRKILLSNIIITGGNTMFPGFAERFKAELWNLTSERSYLRTIVPEERKFIAWLGGSILASLSASKRMFLNRGEYWNFGQALVHTKCLL